MPKHQKHCSKAADSDVAEVRVAAISALGDQIQKGDNLRAQNRVFQALEDVSADVRAEAVTLIGKSCDAEDVETLLLKKLSDEDTQVRKNTALSLMKLDAIGSIQQLKIAEQKEDDPDVKAVIRVAINILSAKNS